MFTLSGIVTWGRSYQEYVDMFHLQDWDFDHPIIGCGDGPASFNAVISRMGHRVISCDPLYRFCRDEIETRIASARAEVMEQVRNNQDNFNWDYFSDLTNLEDERISAMKVFLADFEQGRKEGRYIPAELPVLPFQDKSFGLALSSHLLFLYPSLGYSFHLKCLMEMLRIAGEVRVYPIVDVNCRIPPFRDEILGSLREAGYDIDLVKVKYNFIKNGDCMLRIKPSADIQV